MNNKQASGEETPEFHVQISGDTPWCVLSWRTFEQYEDVSNELVAVYGPVPSKETADALARALEAAATGTDCTFTVMPICPVRQGRPAGADPAVVA